MHDARSTYQLRRKGSFRSDRLINILDEELNTKQLLECITACPQEHEIVVDADTEAECAALKRVHDEVLRPKGYTCLLFYTSLVNPTFAYRYRARSSDSRGGRRRLHLLVEDRWTHHVLTTLIEERGAGQIRSAVYDERGKKTRDSQPVRIPGFLPAAERVAAEGKARGTTEDGCMRDASIRNYTEPFYTVEVLQRILAYVKQIAVVAQRWADNEPQSARREPATAAYAIRKDVVRYKRTAPAEQPSQPPVGKYRARRAISRYTRPSTRRRLVDKRIPAEARRRLARSVKLGEHRHRNAFAIVLMLAWRGWSKSDIVALIEEGHVGLEAYRHSRATQDGNESRGLKRLARDWDKAAKVIASALDGAPSETRERVWKAAWRAGMDERGAMILLQFLTTPGRVIGMSYRRLMEVTGYKSKESIHQILVQQLIRLGIVKRFGDRHPNDWRSQLYMVTASTPQLAENEQYDYRPPTVAGLADLCDAAVLLRGAGVALRARAGPDVLVFDRLRGGDNALWVLQEMGDERRLAAKARFAAVKAQHEAERKAFRSRLEGTPEWSRKWRDLDQRMARLLAQSRGQVWSTAA